MGFILSIRSKTLLRNVVTILIINGFWRHNCTRVLAVLDHSQEQVLQHYVNNNQVHEEGHLHEDGWCDCNSQGPWHPLFKPSQAIHSDVHYEVSHSAENSIDDEALDHGQDIPNDFKINENFNSRRAKKQNHMIHLHLIPHIYVPIIHPVKNSVTDTAIHENNYEIYNHKEHPYLVEQEDNSMYAEQDTHEIHKDHENNENQFQHGDHSSDIQSGELLNLPPVTNSYTDKPHVEDSHESSDSVGYPLYPFPTVHYHYDSPKLEEESNNNQQYQVHEESSNEYQNYGDFATSSNTNTRIVHPNSSITFMKAKQKFKQFHDRSQLNKKFIKTLIEPSVKRLRMMRPPAPAQKETWIVNIPYSEKDVGLFPVKMTFDSPKLLTKNSIFNLKPSLLPQKFIQPIRPGLPIAMPLVKPDASMPVPVYAPNFIG